MTLGGDISPETANPLCMSCRSQTGRGQIEIPVVCQTAAELIDTCKFPHIPIALPIVQSEDGISEVIVFYIFGPPSESVTPLSSNCSTNLIHGKLRGCPTRIRTLPGTDIASPSQKPAADTSPP